jgi:dTDP-glucose 4,6-dehydratase
MGKPQDWFDFVNDRPGHDMRYAINPTKLMTELDWRPGYQDLESGLEQTVAWYSDNRSWWEPLKAATEKKYAALGR